jgi:hypothetical protein
MPELALSTPEWEATPRPVATVEIVVPIYNEEAGLEASIRRPHTYLTERFSLTWRVTIVDNASTDGTWAIACRLAAQLEGVHARHLDRKSRGRALRAAWSSSTASVVAHMDVDLWSAPCCSPSRSSMVSSPRRASCCCCGHGCSLREHPRAPAGPVRVGVGGVHDPELERPRPPGRRTGDGTGLGQRRRDEAHLAVEGTTVGAFGLVRLGQLVLLDRVLFHRTA